MNPSVVNIFSKAKSEGSPGLPKHPQTTGYIDEGGVAGDYNKFRATKKNNTLERAILLYTVEMIEELKKEGWNIKQGHLGENILLKGIPYSKFKPGLKLTINDVIIEITILCVPCKSLEVLPCVGNLRIKEFIKTIKGRRGWFGKVLKPGTITVDNPVYIS